MRLWQRLLMFCALGACMPAQAAAERLWMHSVHLNEELRVSVASELSFKDWRLANHFFRSRKTKQRRTVHPRLLRLLRHLQKHFGNRKLELISGYRQPEKGERLNSYHQVGRAADIRIPGIPKEELFRYCQTLSDVGCGYYPNAEFVHLDVRGTSTVWVDISRPGQPRNYVSNARAWLRARNLLMKKE